MYAIDLPGFGESDKPIDVDYSIDFQARQLDRFIDHQEITKAILLGWSMGGWVSLKFASQSPQKVERLIVAASPGIGMKYETGIDVQRLLTPQTMVELRELFHAMGATLPPEFIQRERKCNEKCLGLQRT